ncbi:hypothetical protein GCM10010266_56790 [Streptomyces griseomycini]|uniref:hypothetical protein n=1 Tax=Streptomyces griseomycini TaxID=66895 RepID=UPI0018744B0D|nr:hypothetical protein [Streptomyces griseomycini]GGQ26165.1 hypothetical protein GCM10010266_56790 [Streptomyces griseomycini]
MLALRLTRGAHPAVQLRRLLVATASAGTGFLLLCALGHALGHPGTPSASALRLAWCAAPMAATVYFAVAVARSDPGTRPRPGLSAVGLGPARLMAVSAATTALSCALGSLFALLVFLLLRGDLTGVPFGGAATDSLAVDRPLPLPAALTLLALVPLSASAAVAVALRPREPVTGAPRSARAYGRFGAGRRPARPETFGAYGRFGKHLGTARGRRATAVPQEQAQAQAQAQRQDGVPDASGAVTDLPETVPGTPETAVGALPAAVRPALSGLPWGITVLAVGLAVEVFASRTGADGAPADRPGALVGLALTAAGLALAGPGLTHLCGLLLQTARPGALRLLAGRILMTEAVRIGRPLGVVCAVLSAACTMVSLNEPEGPSVGPLTALGVLLVAGCTTATLLTAAVEAKHARADTTAALLRLGAPVTTLRKAAALRAGALLALFGPLTLLVAELSAWTLAR